MKLDPVYLVAPRPTRRSFLLAGGAFAGGVVLGGAGGFALGVNVAAAPVGTVLEKTGNAELDELRRLAVEAPIEELVASAFSFLSLRARTHAEDPVLVRGVERLGEYLLVRSDDPSRVHLAKFVLRAARVGAAQRDPKVQALVGRLEALGK